ncbi:MAG: ferredoxin [Bacteriovoracaceae bacterium]
MPSSSLIAMGVAGVAIAGAISSIAGFSLLIGAVDFLFGKPKLTVLKSIKGANGFAFAFEWDNGKEPARFDRIKVRLFNPFGTPTQIDASKDFEAKSSSFAMDVELAPLFENIIEAKGLEKSLVQIEVFSSKDGISFQFEYKGLKFKEMMLNSGKTSEQFAQKWVKKVNPNLAKFGVAPAKSMIADTVPGKGPSLKIASNPEFAGDFSAAGGTSSVAGGEALPQFNVSKVWIEPGCIVCNACENIYPEVFEVLADTCIIRPGAPLDLGLKIKEAAEACPVEVIKFTKAG